MVDRTGEPVEERIEIAEERASSSAQIRTLFNEQRRTMIAECCEKVSHHEFQAARAEQERKILQEELWRQQQDFREVHQQNLTEMEELRKFQSSTFDTIARLKLIEDQNTILELSGRLQELQNEVNCMNDSKDFQDAESVRSENSHVTSQLNLHTDTHSSFCAAALRQSECHQSASEGRERLEARAYRGLRRPQRGCGGELGPATTGRANSHGVGGVGVRSEVLLVPPGDAGLTRLN